MSDTPTDYQRALQASQAFWDSHAATFDEAADHGLSNPQVLAAWTSLLAASIPQTQQNVLDIGCGTGSLSLVLAHLGHQVTGIDVSPAMLQLAKEKARLAEQTIDFQVMDAAFPDFPSQQFDVLICRHLLWMLPEPEQVLLRWKQLLKAGGRFILIEGYWHTGAGLPAQDLLKLLPPAFEHIQHQNLSLETALWGKTVQDERYLILAQLP